MREFDRTATDRFRILLSFDLEWDDSKAILDGISQFAEGRWNVTLDTTGDTYRRLSWVTQASWNGIITRHVSVELAERCAREGVPLVDMHDSRALPGVPKVRPDNRKVGSLGAEHLLDRGLKNFAFYGTCELWAKERMTGFQERLLAAGYRVYSLDAPEEASDVGVQLSQQSCIQEWLTGLPKPLGLMACNDLYALEISHACNDAEISIPESIAILGANDDQTRCKFANPPLSSVVTNRQMAGFRAAAILESMIADGEAQRDLEELIEPVRVVTQRSTDVLAVADTAIRDAIAFIRRSSGIGIAAADVVRVSGLTRNALERRFRRELGLSPHAYIRKIQLAKVKEYLVGTDLPLKHIADLVGIPHTEYLNVLFAREVGVPPGHYRRLRRVSARAD